MPCVFLNVNPHLVDFNIHPAKREARFSDISDIHHGLSSSLRTFYHNYTYQNFINNKPADEPEANPQYTKHISYVQRTSESHPISDFRAKYFGRQQSVSQLAEEALSKVAPDFIPEQKKVEQIRFIGSALGTFLIAQKSNSLYIIDQHAVHERILFDKIMSNQGGRQSLLIPYKIKTESKPQDNQLEKLKERLNQIGFETEKIEDGYWEVKSIPERWTGTEYDFRSLLFVKNVEPEQIIRSIAAMTACKAAVKDGYVLDGETAARLVEQAFELEDPHCPHGRPIYTVLSRERLFELVKRT